MKTKKGEKKGVDPFGKRTSFEISGSNPRAEVIVASTNPSKIRAVEKGFSDLFPDVTFSFRGIDAPSDVRSQPMSEEETLHGAFNRMEFAHHHSPHARYWVGIEGGCAFEAGEVAVFAWVVVRSGPRTAKARTGSFYLPPEMVRRVGKGVELGEVCDELFHRQDSKRNLGAIGLLTGGRMKRSDYYRHAVILALIPFHERRLYEERQARKGASLQRLTSPGG